MPSDIIAAELFKASTLLLTMITTVKINAFPQLRLTVQGILSFFGKTIEMAIMISILSGMAATALRWEPIPG